MRIIIRRFIELLIVEILFSVIAVGLNVSGIVTERQHIVVMLIAFIVIYLVLNIYQLRFCYEDLYGDGQYYVLNFTACILFFAVVLISCFFMPKSLYTWLFSLMKVLYYLDLGNVLSILVFFVPLFIIIAIAPIGIDWVDVEDEEDMNRLMEYGDEQNFAPNSKSDVE